MKCLLLSGLVFLLVCCGHPSAINRQLSGSDSLLINFNSENSDLIEKTMNTTDRKAIREIIGFAGGKEIRAINCSYDGNLMFYKNGILQGDLAFNFTEDSCRQFHWEREGIIMATEMSRNAADFFRSLSQGRGWY